MTTFVPPSGPGRCPTCGQHVPTQAHRPGCLRASTLTRAEARAEAAAQRRAAIDSCPQCDPSGLVEIDPGGTALRRCNHKPDRPVSDWMTDVEDRRDAIAQKLAELNNHPTDQEIP